MSLHPTTGSWRRHIPNDTKRGSRKIAQLVTSRRHPACRKCRNRHLRNQRAHLERRWPATCNQEAPRERPPTPIRETRHRLKDRRKRIPAGDERIATSAGPDQRRKSFPHLICHWLNRQKQIANKSGARGFRRDPPGNVSSRCRES